MTAADEQRLKNLVHGDRDTDPLANHPSLQTAPRSPSAPGYPRAPERHDLRAASDALDPLAGQDFDAKVRAARRTRTADEPRVARERDAQDPIDPSAYDRKVAALRAAQLRAARGE